MIKTNKLIMLIGFVCLGFLVFQAINPSTANANLKCSGGNCWYVTCQTNSECGTNQFTGAQKCDANNVYQDYITFTCNAAGTADAYCARSITSRHQQSCGSSQTCSYGTCVDNARTSGYTNSNRNYLKCAGNSVYWFDNNGNQQGLYQTCNANQTCSGNTCVASTYISHAFKGCFNNSVYWYNSQGTQQDAYQNCSLSGQTCQNGGCVVSQAPYAQPTSYVKPAAAVTVTQVVKSDKLSVSLLGKNSTDATNWSKEINGSSNQTVNFLVTVKNISDSKMDNITLKADFAENTNVNNVKIDNADAQGSLALGILLGSLEKGASKIISFDGTITSTDEKNGVKITATANSKDISDSDSLIVNIAKSSVATASVVDSGAMSFIKKWYLWVIGIIVLISLFTIIFRRLSNNV